MYGIASHGQQQEESEDEQEYDVFSEVEKERVIKTYSKESATSKVQWNKQEQEQLQIFKELALLDNSSGETRTIGVSTFSSPAASHDSTSRAAGQSSNFASNSNNFMGNKDHIKQDSESALFHFSSGLHGESSSDQQHRKSRDNNLLGAKMSIDGSYGALKNMKQNPN